MFHLKIHCFHFCAPQDRRYRLDQLIAPAQLQAKTKNFFASALQDTLNSHLLDQAFVINYLFIKFSGSCCVLKQT